MRKVLQLLGIILLVAIVGIGTVIGYAAYHGSKLDRSSKAYVDESLPAIARSWSKEELLNRASPELLQVVETHPEQIQPLFDKFAKLGALQHYNGSKGEATIHVDPNKGKVVTATYLAHATFEQGEAEISVQLIWDGHQWRYLTLNVNSPVLLR